MKWLMVPVAVLAIGLPKACQGTHEVHLPPTAQCPSGVWVVTSEGDITNAVCKASPTPSPVSSPAPPSPPPASPSPEPSASPSPEPVPSPSPVASPSPVPSASPAPSPSPVSVCPRPDDVSLAPNTPVKKDIGYRNTFDVSPWHEGDKIRAESGCTRELVEKYGEFEGIIIIDGQRSGFEHQGCSLEDVQAGRCDPRWEDFYLYVDATNSDSNWSGDTYLGAGDRTYCVSYRHLAHYKCVTCTMTTDGKVTNCGGRQYLEK